ncbi:hypothetical protein J1614_001721 [Plenodomus biglobosus]|nr:hypothetical protein J1614_001721 [Plenodomus biglobosus]
MHSLQSARLVEIALASMLLTHGKSPPDGVGEASVRPSARGHSNQSLGWHPPAHASVVDNYANHGRSAQSQARVQR